MQENFLERLANRVPRYKRDDESYLHSQIKKLVSKTKAKKKHINVTFSNRGGLISMGARGPVLNDNSLYSRRVVVKASYILSRNKNARDRIREHLGYNARDRIRYHLEYAARNKSNDLNKSNELYSKNDENIDIKKTLNNYEKAPHIFNIIISPEDGDKLQLKEYTREFVKKIENDLGTTLDWVAANHYDTNEPHVHLLIKGQDDLGIKLIMTRDYISRGLRVRASQVATIKLGLRSLNDVKKSLELEICKPKKNELDSIIIENSIEGRIKPRELSANAREELPKKLIEQRLEYLVSKDLATKKDNNEYKIKENYLDDLRNIAKTTSIIERLSSGLRVNKKDCEIISAQSLTDRVIKGHVVERGYVNEHSEKEYLLIKSKDKRFLYVELEKYSEKSPALSGEFVRIETTKPFLGPKVSDKTIYNISKNNNGIYDAKNHEKYVKDSGKLPPNVSAKEFVNVHIKRLQLLARKGLVSKREENRFHIPHHFIKDLEEETKKCNRAYNPHIKVIRLSPARLKTPSIKRGFKP